MRIGSSYGLWEICSQRTMEPEPELRRPVRTSSCRRLSRHPRRSPAMCLHGVPTQAHLMLMERIATHPPHHHSSPTRRLGRARILRFPFQHSPRINHHWEISSKTISLSTPWAHGRTAGRTWKITTTQNCIATLSTTDSSAILRCLMDMEAPWHPSLSRRTFWRSSPPQRAIRQICQRRSSTPVPSRKGNSFTCPNNRRSMREPRASWSRLTRRTSLAVMWATHALSCQDLGW
mmetsp:Transcript_4243/g.7767  ORF Transcript_4243/g.7767 Transcript_4243/m.7767 type:complete len:233 (-) Transcript_4243:2148-2846(-)